MDRISKFLDDKSFVKWVLNPDSELNLKWDNYQENHSGESANLLLAKNVLLKFKTVDKELTEQERIVLFAKIVADIEQKQTANGRIRMLLGWGRYAAIAILFFAIGAVLFYQKKSSNEQYIIQNMSEPAYGELTTLVRPNGENIQLAENKTTIDYEKSQSKLIINDSIEVDQIKSQEKVALNQLNVPFGKTSEVILSDGSKVYLNAGSRLLYPDFFVGKEREVFLVGEAFFEIHKDEMHPFIVQTTDINIEVRGTKFNLSAYQSDNFYETVLTEGKVRIRQNEHGIFERPVDIEPNQMASFNRYQKEIKVSKVDVENYMLWKEGMFKFESSNLSWVTKKLERYYNIRFTFQNAGLRNMKISGKLELSENESDVVDVLMNTAGIKITKQGDKLYVIK